MPASQETYKNFARFYDIYVGTFNADFEFYDAHCRKNEAILEIGCGTGRILEFLLKGGFTNVTGIDISPDMLELAHIKLKKYIVNNSLKLKNHDFTNVKLKDKYDVVILSFYTFNYILDNPLGFLKNVRKSLNEKGFLLMDLFYPICLKNPLNNNVLQKKELEIEENRISLIDKRTMSNNLEKRDQIFIVKGQETKIATIRRYFSPNEIKKLLMQAGYSHTEMAVNYDISIFNTSIEENSLESNFLVRAIE